VILALPVVAAVLTLAASTAHAHPQLSLRQNFGAGWRSGQAREAMFETGLRSELLFGGAAVDELRVGFAIDLRTSDFVTAEASGGGALLIPIAAGFPLTLHVTAGWASRPGALDGPIAVSTLAFGYRAYNHHSVYGFALNVYATTRTWLDDPATNEVTFGVEIDLAFTLGVPFMFVYTWLAHGDPDEEE
jgi:hypothetical protein